MVLGCLSCVGAALLTKGSAFELLSTVILLGGYKVAKCDCGFVENLIRKSCIV